MIPFIEGAATVAKNGTILECTVDDGTVLLVEEVGQYLWLNSTASFVWEQLAGPADFASLRESYRERFSPLFETSGASGDDAVVSVLDTDLVSTLADLLSLGAIIQTPVPIE